MNLSATPRSFKTMLHGAAVAAGLGALVVSTVYCQDPTYASVRLVPTSQFCVDGFSRAAILAGNADVARTVPKAVSATTVLCDGDAAKTLVLQPTRQGDTASFGVVVVAAKSDTALAECIQSGQFENCVVARRILSYKTNSALRLEIGLDSSCAGVDASCQTPSAANVPGYLGACVAGLCNNGNLTGREAECVDAVCDDNSLPCTAGERRACGSVRTIGICKRGEQTCGPRGRWEACMGELRPTGLDCTSSRDNNCDGQPDAASSLCKCDGTFSAGQTQACEPHPGKDGLGPCQPGLRSCVASASGVDAPAWGPCAGSIGPTPSDVCSDTIDNDCNGIVNDGCACKADAERACGPVALNQVGICVAGTQKCTDGKWPSTCSGSVDPKARDCSSPLDNDCNRVNDNLETACLCDGTVPVGGKQTCNGHGSLDGVGQCRAGSRTCTLGAGGAPTFGPCADAVGPATDGPGFCDGIDNDCNGIVDQGCGCTSGATQDCGPIALNGIGICKKGQQTCQAGVFGACVGAVDKRARDCSSGQDNDCNGTPDNLESGCLCNGFSVGQSAACGQHPGKDGVGICRSGSQTCMGNGANPPSFGPCQGSVGPGADGPPSSCNGIDEDCDGYKDNGCGCIEGATQPCGQYNVGVCKYGTRTCAGGLWGDCVGAIGPSQKNCGTDLDSDCNGMIDSEEAVCTCPLTCVPANCCNEASCDGAGNCIQGPKGKLCIDLFCLPQQ